MTDRAEPCGDCMKVRPHKCPRHEKPTPLEPSRGTICRCGSAKSYHSNGRITNHEYEPRYPARRVIACTVPEHATLDAATMTDRAEPGVTPLTIPTDLSERNRMFPHPHEPLGSCRICQALDRLATLDAAAPRPGLAETLALHLKAHKAIVIREAWPSGWEPLGDDELAAIADDVSAALTSSTGEPTDD